MFSCIQANPIFIDRIELDIVQGACHSVYREELTKRLDCVSLFIEGANLKTGSRLSIGGILKPFDLEKDSKPNTQVLLNRSIHHD